MVAFALAAALATAVVIVIGGGLVAIFTDRTEHRALDERLADQVTSIQSDLDPALETGSFAGSVDIATRRPDVGTVLRVYRDGHLVAAVGALPDVIFPIPLRGGYSSVPAAGRSWRVLDRVVPADSAIRAVTGSTSPLVVEAAVPSSTSDELVEGLRNRIFQVAFVSSVLAGFAGWFFGGYALRPLARLRATTEGVSTSRDLSARVSATDGPQEVDALANSFNVMLERLQEAAASTEAALESSRAFAGNAAHEMRTPLTSMQANLDVLAKNPNLPVDEWKEIVRSIDQEQSRLVRLLDALHTIARGDIVADSQKEPMDLADVTGVAIDTARYRFPETEFRYAVPSVPTELDGWSDGLRVMVDNLLTNAARHGGHIVDVSIEREDRSILLLVDDDGPGVPEAERTVIFERFVRGTSAGSSGTGLGLALVGQQARIHGGEVTVESSPLGGARFKVRLAARAGDVV